MTRLSSGIVIFAVRTMKNIQFNAYFECFIAIEIFQQLRMHPFLDMEFNFYSSFKNTFIA